MRIVLCCRAYSVHGRPGGMIHVVVERAEELARQGHEVFVLTTNNGHRITDGSVNGVMVRNSLGAILTYCDEYAEFCLNECKRLRPDIIHLDSWDKHRLWWDGLKASVTNHGEAVGSQLTDWRLRMHGRSVATPGAEAEVERCTKCTGDVRTCEWSEERSQLLKARTVVATCRFDRWLLSDLLSLPRVKLVYNPLAPYHHYQCRPWGVERPFLAVGVWGHGERGFDVAKEACQKLGAELLVPKNVPRRELVSWYDRSCALLLPGFQSKGYDLAVAECLARQRPVYIADNGVGTMEAVDQPWIVTVPAGDADALVEALGRSLPSVPTWAADQHRPEYHVKEWLDAVA